MTLIKITLFALSLPFAKSELLRVLHLTVMILSEPQNLHLLTVFITFIYIVVMATAYALLFILE